MYSATPIPPDLLMPADGQVRLPAPRIDGAYTLTADELWLQLVEGVHNPGYFRADDINTAVSNLAAWRHQAMACDEAARGGEDKFYGSHLTNALARIACSPYRGIKVSLKEVYKDEERHFPQRCRGRNPLELSILYNSLCSLRATLRA